VVWVLPIRNKALQKLLGTAVLFCPQATLGSLMKQVMVGTVGSNGSLRSNPRLFIVALNAREKICCRHIVRVSLKSLICKTISRHGIAVDSKTLQGVGI
jgi:hypothetical protein